MCEELLRPLSSPCGNGKSARTGDNRETDLLHPVSGVRNKMENEKKGEQYEKTSS